MASNLPPGTTQAMIDRYYGDDEYSEPDDQELEEMYLDQLEQEAENLPEPVFFEVWAPFEVNEMPVRKPMGVQLSLFEERIAA